MPRIDTDLENTGDQIVVPNRRATCTLSPHSKGFNLEDIRIGKAQYEPKVSQCACKDLRVFIDFEQVWTDCKLHGWVCLGLASRIYAVKAVRA